MNTNRLQPNSFKEFIGQNQIKENLKIFIMASKKKKKPLEHLLFYGAAGCGKTTISYLIANEMGKKVVTDKALINTEEHASKLITSSGATLKKPVDIVTLLHSLTPNSILFIDEIHRLRSELEEVLYPAMEEFKIDIIVGEDDNAKPTTIDLPPFTLIGATTRLGMLTTPLINRFRNVFRVVPYTLTEMTKIVKQSAEKLQIKIGHEAIEIIAEASRRVPRIANNLLKDTYDYTIVKNKKAITREIAKQTLEALGIRENGLTEVEIEMLQTLLKRFKHNPVGLTTMAQIVDEEKDTITDVYEPYLMRLGFIVRTPKGRVITNTASKYIRGV